MAAIILGIKGTPQISTMPMVDMKIPTLERLFGFFALIFLSVHSFHFRRNRHIDRRFR
jgi:hypothetical protein